MEALVTTAKISTRDVDMKFNLQKMCHTDYEKMKENRRHRNQLA